LQTDSNKPYPNTRSKNKWLYPLINTPTGQTPSTARSVGLRTDISAKEGHQTAMEKWLIISQKSAQNVVWKGKGFISVSIKLLLNLGNGEINTMQTIVSMSIRLIKFHKGRQQLGVDRENKWNKRERKWHGQH
jgi:hypothetical protein